MIGTRGWCFGILGVMRSERRSLVVDLGTVSKHKVIKD